MIKIVTVIGARPQFIKAAAVSREILNTGKIQEVIVHTGQHFDFNMNDIFFEEMKIPKPDYNLNIHGLSHGAMTGQMLEKIEDVIKKEKPEYVMVYGDTNSTIAGSLAAVKLHVPVAHVEAGLRSFNMNMPEEVNRILTDRISKILFCPTDNAVKNLKDEGFEKFDCKIIKSGDVMQDAALYYSKESGSRSSIVKKIGLDKFALCTIHRAENTDDPDRLNGIFAALSQINHNTPIVLPLHPRTKQRIESLNICIDNLLVIEPVGYFDMIELIKGSSLVLTDSGGLQKEAFFFQRPCVTLRDETEWVELVDNGYNLLVGSNTNHIIDGYKEMIGKRIIDDKDLYGGGCASKKIIGVLIS